MNTRPVSVTIKAEHKTTHEVKHVEQDNNWAIQTDIKRGEEETIRLARFAMRRLKLISILQEHGIKILILCLIQTNMIKVEV